MSIVPPLARPRGVAFSAATACSKPWRDGVEGGEDIGLESGAREGGARV